MPYVHLEDLSQFVLLDPLPVLHITRCPLPGLHNFDNVPVTLILEDISTNIDLSGTQEPLTHLDDRN